MFETELLTTRDHEMIELIDSPDSTNGTQSEVDHAYTGHVLPNGLEELRPGPFLSAVLSTVDFSKLSASDRVAALRAAKRMSAHYEGRALEAIASVAEMYTDEDTPVEEGFEAAELEIRSALRLTRRAGETALNLAEALKHRLPAVAMGMDSGVIDYPRARVMVDETRHLSEQTARDVVDQVINRAPRLTTGQLRALIRKLCVESNPEEAAERYEQAVSDRCVITDPNEMGTADLLILNVAPEKAAAASDHINYLAKKLRRGDETRSMDQLRADVAMDLLIGNQVGMATRKGVVDIHVDLETLTEMTEASGDLAGYGPVVADIARQVVDQSGESEWRFTIDDPDSGMPIGGGLVRRRPDSHSSRHVLIKNQTCIAPGCRMPATGCDIDHITPYAEGGDTKTSNLAPLCRHDHVQRHEQGWSYEKLDDGDHLWISPLGIKYTTTGRAPP